ncbi:hypothetical protein HOY82DRAFT_639911, partial [Tuber indicum]
QLATFGAFSQANVPTPLCLGRVFKQEKVGAQRPIAPWEIAQWIDTVYYQKNGYWYSLPRQVFTDPTESDIPEFRLPLERDFVPPTFFDNLSPPLPSRLCRQFNTFFAGSRVMAPPGITFTGDDKIGIRAFMSWMDSWFVTQGEEYAGNSPQAKRMKVAQIHVACPIKSVAGRFLRQLPDVLWDEEKLWEALIEQFDETKAEENAQEDILLIMSGFGQGDRTVFSYSRKVLGILCRKPAKVNQFAKVLIRYYIDGLASRRLREMAIISLQRQDSNETPYKVVKGVMRLARQLKMKGYKKCRNGDSTESSDEGESSSCDDSGSSSDSDDDKAYKQLKKSARKSKRQG